MEVVCCLEGEGRSGDTLESKQTRRQELVGGHRAPTMRWSGADPGYCLTRFTLKLTLIIIFLT